LFGGSDLCLGVVLAKAVKPSRKFSSQSSGVSIMEETSSVNVKISGGGSGWALACVLDLFNSGPSTSDVVAPVLR
jgi:hypothetical protein